MPSMCAPIAWPNIECPSGVRMKWDTAPIGGAVRRETRPASTMRSTKRVTPPVVSATWVLSLLWSTDLFGASYVDEHVNPDQGDARTSAPSRARANSVGRRWERHEETLRRRRSSSICSRTPQVPRRGPLRRPSSSGVGTFRRAHIAPLNLFQLSSNTFYLIDKYLLSPILSIRDCITTPKRSLPCP